MARLCIRIADNKHPTDPDLDAFRTQINEVVCVTEDGHKFSEAELNCGQYKFIDVNGVAQADLIYLIDPVLDPLDVEGIKISGIRKSKLDPKELKKAKWEDGSKVTKSDVDSIVLTKG